MDRGVWRATVHGVAKSQRRLNDFHLQLVFKIVNERNLQESYYKEEKTNDMVYGSDGKESACNAGDLGLISGLGRSPGEGHGNPLQYSGLENSMGRGAGGLQSMGSQGLDMTELLTLLLFRGGETRGTSEGDQERTTLR